MNVLEVIALCISIVMAVLAFITLVRNVGKDKNAELNIIKESVLKANMKLDHVCATTNETRTDIKSLNRDIAEMDRRVTIVERDVKTAFHNIEEIKEAINDDGK